VEEWQSRKFGLFIHWGLYSIAGGVWNGKPVRSGYSEQIQGEGRIPKEDYVKLAAQFNRDFSQGGLAKSRHLRHN